MKQLFTIFVLLPFFSLAQTNIVVRLPNSVTPAENNTIIGPNAGSTTMTGNQNTFIGSYSGNSNAWSGANTFVGYYSGFSTKNGSGNTFTGWWAGMKNESGENNSYFGSQAGGNGKYGTSNTFLGSNAGYKNEGSYNLFAGNDAGYNNNTGLYNTILGYSAGYFIASGNSNTFLGSQAGYYNYTGNYNVFLGVNAGWGSTQGGSNTFVGTGSGYSNSIGSNNTAFGYQSGYTANSQTGSTFLGTNSGIGNKFGMNNTFVGYKAGGLEQLSNATAIGANALVKSNNSIVLGDTSLPTKVGIGLTAPQYPLDIRGIINLRNNGTIKFSHISNPFLRNGYTDQFLTVNGQGETILAKYRMRIDNVNQWSDKVFSPTYQLKPLIEVEKHVQRYGHLPNVPSAEELVKDGIDPAKMDAKLLEKIEELTLYSIQQQKENQALKAEMAELKAIVRQLMDKK